MNEGKRAAWAVALRAAPDSKIQRPLWEFFPALRPLVIHERRVRFGVQEETGDPEYG